MRYLYLTLFITLLSFASCKKNIDYSCPLDPTLVLAPDGYTTQQWDTLVLKLYQPNTTQLVSTDTLTPKNLQDVIVIYVDEQYDYDLAVEVPTVGKTHWIREISLSDEVVTIDKDAPRPDCYKKLSYKIDGMAKNHKSIGIVTEKLKYP